MQIIRLKASLQNFTFLDIKKGLVSIPVCILSLYEYNSDHELRATSL